VHRNLARCAEVKDLLRVIFREKVQEVRRNIFRKIFKSEVSRISEGAGRVPEVNFFK
jgi:hypothetical protein